MKKLKILFTALVLMFSVLLTSCGTMSNMSNEDAYNVGYGVGTLMRNAIDN